MSRDAGSKLNTRWIAWFACALVVVVVVAAMIASRRDAAPVGSLDEQPLAMIVDENPQPHVLRAQQRERRILREAGELGSRHAWAGRYHWSTGFVYAHLSLAPRSGAVLVHGSDVIGSEAYFEGALRTGADGSIQVQWLEAARRAYSPFVPAALIPIRWGDRRYLVAAERLPRFVDAINLGEEPRMYAIVRSPEHDAFALLRENDELKPVSGVPQLSAGPLPGVRLAPQPIEVVEVVVVERRRTGDGCSIDYRFVLGRGRDEDLQVGEVLDMRSAEVQGQLQVSDVGPRQSRALWSQDGCSDRLASLRGAKVSRKFYNPVAAQMALAAAALDRPAGSESK
ncbi:hypothetical protein [Lysobacter sp. CA199]|uniref:hypothetical protein n=1 Tax=Lysobacter sp. CA199 TaxID=3455608 RepID=UPI003F8CFAAC